MSDGDFGAALVGGLIGYSLGSSSQSLSRAEKEEIKLDARESWSNLSVNDKRDHLKSCTKDQASSKQGSLITLTIVILIFTVFGAMVMSTMGGSAGIFTEFSERMAQNPGGDANTFLDKSKLNQGVVANGKSGERVLFSPTLDLIFNYVLVFILAFYGYKIFTGLDRGIENQKNEQLKIIKKADEEKLDELFSNYVSRW